MSTDSHHRALAIDPHESFTVTAPAGSGKTELLSQRFLALLAVVEYPEQILAITFTRKAVAEMRERVLAALRLAAHLTREELTALPEHRYATIELARCALKRDEECSWHLLDNPSRLRIFTFDAFSASIVRQLPLSSRFGGTPSQSDDPTPYYERAAQRVLELSGTDARVGESVNRLLRHLDCKVDRLHALLCDTLARRDQWRAIFSRLDASKSPGGAEFNQLQGFLSERIESRIRDCDVLLHPFTQQLCALINFANDNLAIGEPSRGRDHLAALPNVAASNLQEWRRIAEFLLTSSGQFRARVDKRHGFPAKSTKPKYSIDDLKSLISAIQDTSPNAAEQLNELLLLPDVSDLANNQELIVALLDVMRHAMAYLELEFQARQEVDFVATSVQALRALHEEGEVAVRLDYQIRHILVDEFQDTSQVQYDLLQSLCADWSNEAEEGRSLFLVGDAMQSIYAFRNARVALFMHARRYGLAKVKMKALTLSSNFRSYPPILEWVNHCFSRAFPNVDDVSIGASAFVESISQREDNSDSAVRAFEYELIDGNRDAEAAHITEQILHLKEREPDASIAILVRSRNQAQSLYPYFRQANIAWQATEFESLAKQAVVSDLLCLTEICVNPSNTVSWYAVLRSPFIGLPLSDLLAVSQSRMVSGLDAFERALKLDALSEHGKTRIRHLLRQYRGFQQNRHRQPINAALRGLWRALGGEHFYDDDNSYQISMAYFNELAAQTAKPKNFSWDSFLKSVKQLYANPPVKSDNPVQLMTMHKSKGLEFDTVILPSLDRSGRPDDTELLNWLDGVDSDGNASLLLGMYQPGPKVAPNSYSYIREKKKAQASQEKARLLYVACTRAAKRLYLYRGYIQKNDEPKDSSATSLASVIWTHLPQNAVDVTGYENTSQHMADTLQTVATRLSANAVNKLMAEFPKREILVSQRQETPSDLPKVSKPSLEDVEQRTWEKSIGTIVHSELRLWHSDGKPDLSQDRLGKEASWRTQLQQLGVQRSHNDAIKAILQVMSAAATDHENAWLFSHSLAEDASELSLRVNTAEGVKSICIDRTFLDENGQRWIIDYKVHLNASASSEELESLASSHKQQLLAYQSAFDEPCCLAIYFLLQQQIVVLREAGR